MDGGWRQKRINWLLLLRLMQSYFLSIVQTPVFVRSKRRMVRKSCSSNSRKNRVYLAGYGLCLLCMRPCANEAMMENAIYASEWKNQFLLLYFFPAEADAFFPLGGRPISYLIKPPARLGIKERGPSTLKTVIQRGHDGEEIWPILAMNSFLPFTTTDEPKTLRRS